MKRKYNPHTIIGLIFLLLLLALLLLGRIKINENNIALASPVDGIDNLDPVVSKQNEVKISCELGVPEYLECQAAKGIITWKEAEIMTAIAKAESQLNPKAKNRNSTASGIFQIIASTWYHYDCVGDKWDWKDNTNCAIKIMKRSGFTPWEVYNKQTYKKYLNGN
jgi:hypothetical protein